MSQGPSQMPVPDVVQAVPVGPDAEQAPIPATDTITEPAKLLRIASMVRELLEETRQTSLDEPGRKRLAEIYGRSVGELAGILSEDLREELASLAPPIEDGVPTESELRVAQAQLVGWLEGLFHGIQAAMFAQQASARAQFEELRRRGLPAQSPEGGPAPQENERTPGQYL
ncbi:MAG TPA: proteasome activator [Actinomycetota bacterium]|nr:proteasome activator [Actinomycetota bacterium]